MDSLPGIKISLNNMSSFRASITVIGIVFLMVTLGVIIPITRIGDGVNQEGFIFSLLECIQNQ